MPRRPQKGKSQSWLVHASNQNNHSFTMNSLNARQVDASERVNGSNVTASEKLTGAGGIVLQKINYDDGDFGTNDPKAFEFAQDLAESARTSLAAAVDAANENLVVLTQDKKLRLFDNSDVVTKRADLGVQGGNVTNVTIPDGVAGDTITVTITGTSLPADLIAGDKITMGMETSGPSPTVNVAVPTIDAILDGINDATVKTVTGTTEITFDVTLGSGESISSYDATGGGSIATVSGTVAPATAGNDALVYRQCNLVTM